MPHVERFELYKMETPAGRIIGDNNCSYDSISVVALCLKTSDGREGWGYGEACSTGKFARPAYYIQPMASLAKQREEFTARWWPAVQAPDFLQKGLSSPVNDKASFFYLETAVRLASWDLRAQEADLPLWKFLNKDATSPKVRTYGSPLDFPLSDAEAVAKVKDFLALGMKAIKVKVGAPDIQRDIARLRLIIDNVPKDVQITADANIIWNAEQAIKALQIIAAAGITLGYLEDPIPHDDLDGFRRLAQAQKSGEISTPIAAHDYAPSPEAMRRLLETGALTFVRNGNDIDHALKVRRLAKEFGVKMIFGNSVLEWNTHLAAAFAAETDRLEFMDVGWNKLAQNPIVHRNGYSIAPEVPGHGLVPDPAVLKEWAAP